MLGRPARKPDRAWRYGPGPDQVADLYLATQARPSVPVLLIHGGFWRPEYDRTHLRPMAAALAAGGHSTLLIEYARVPGAPDRTMADVRAAVRAAEGPLGRSAPVLVGHSAGGHLALSLAADPAIGAGGCLALAAVADLQSAERDHLDGDAVRAFLGGAAADRADLDPARLPAPGMPTTLVHGRRDSLVPVRYSEDYAAATGARLVTPECGHFELIDPLAPAWPTVLAELAALGGPRVLNG